MHHTSISTNSSHIIVPAKKPIHIHEPPSSPTHKSSPMYNASQWQTKQCHLHQPNRITMHDISSLLFLANASVVNSLAAAWGSFTDFTKLTASSFFITCQTNETSYFSFTCVMRQLLTANIELKKPYAI